MPKNTIGLPPFPPLIVIDTNDLFTHENLIELLQQRPSGVSICLRRAAGPTNRGGYFFHFKPSPKPAPDLMLYDFEGRHVFNFPPQALVAFINHCTGQLFDEPSFILCLTQLNFLQDEQEDA